MDGRVLETDQFQLGQASCLPIFAVRLGHWGYPHPRVLASIRHTRSCDLDITNLARFQTHFQINLVVQSDTAELSTCLSEREVGQSKPHGINLILFHAGKPCVQDHRILITWESATCCLPNINPSSDLCF